jgi:hypothetical protein
MATRRSCPIDYQTAIGSLPARFRDRHLELSAARRLSEGGPTRALPIGADRLRALRQCTQDSAFPGAAARPTTPAGDLRSICARDWAAALLNARLQIVSLQYGAAV